MELEELRGAWRDANTEAATPVARDELIARVCRRVERFWGTILRRDLIEIVAGVLVMCRFTQYAWDPSDTPVARLGAGIVVAGAFFIVYRILDARTDPPAVGLDAPVQQYCRTELARVEKQIGLLSTVRYWYIGPILLGIVVMALGHHGPTPVFFFLLTIFLATAWGAHAMNQHAVRKHLIPLRDGIAELLEDLQASSVGEHQQASNQDRSADGESH